MPHFKKWNCRHCGSLNSILMWHVPMHLTHGSSFSPSGCDPSLESPFLFLCSLKHPVALGGFKERLLGNKWQNNGWCNEKYMKCSLNWEINCFLVLFIPTSSTPFQQVWLVFFFRFGNVRLLCFGFGLSFFYCKWNTLTFDVFVNGNLRV